VADFYAKRGNWAEATRYTELGIARDPAKRSTYQRFQILLLEGQQRYAEAATMAESLLRQNPNDVAALAARAGLLVKRGNPQDREAAAKDYEKLTRLEPTAPVFRFMLGRLYQARGDFDRAQMAYVEAVKLSSSYLPPLMGLAEISLSRQDYKRTVELANRVIAIDPVNPEPRVVLATGQMGLGQYGQAKNLLTEVVRRFPSYKAAEVQLGFVYLNEQQYSQAEALFRKNHKAQADLRALRGLAECQLAQGKPEAALALVQEEVKQTNGAAPVRELLSFVAAKAKQFDFAAESYKPLVDAHPKNAAHHERLADLYRMAGNLEGAIHHFRAALELNPNQSGAAVMLGFLLANKGQKEEASRYYKQALAANPNDPVVLNNLALLLVDSDTSQALKYAQLALARNPNSPAVKDTVGWIYARMSNPDAALQIFETLTRQHPKNATYRYHLGYTLLQKGDHKRAKDQLTQALSSAPEAGDEAAIRKLLATIGS
jgi:tetratricopeptide (TPR) repeat protein